MSLAVLLRAQTVSLVFCGFPERRVSCTLPFNMPPAKRKFTGDARTSKDKLQKGATAEQIEEQPHVSKLVAWSLGARFFPHR